MDEVPLDAKAFNALVDAWSASMLALVMTMPPAQQAAMRSNLARLAANFERQGLTLQETLLIDLHRLLAPDRKRGDGGQPGG